jgi:hypothetical protein
VLQGTVRTVTDFGAFIDSAGSTDCCTLPTCPGAASGNRRCGEGRRLAPGEVLKVNRETHKIRSASSSPARSADRRRGEVQGGRPPVLSPVDFGAFDPGVDGLIHLSEYRRRLQAVRRPKPANRWKLWTSTCRNRIGLG